MNESFLQESLPAHPRRSFWVRLGERVNIVGELMGFLVARRKWWLAPILVVLVLMGFILAVGHGSALSPFLYTVF